MATDVERLIVALEARTTAFERAMAKANGTANRQARSIERRFQQMNRNLSAGFAGLGSSLTKAFAVAGGLRGMQSLLDSATRIDNALKVVGHSGEDLEKIYQRLRKAAADNGAPLETLVGLYSRMAQSQKGLNATTEEIASVTERVAEGLRVQGVSAEQARGPLQQLAQSFSSVIVRAEEFNSLSEGMPIILHAVAAGLKEAGGDIGKLRSLVIESKVSSEAWFRALEAGSVIIQQKVGGATLTVGQGLENLRTAMIDATREFAAGSLAADSLGEAFGMMAERINSINFEAFGEQARALIGMINQIREAMGWLQNMGANLGSMLGTDAIGDWATGGAAQSSFLGGAITITNQRGVQRRIDEAFGQAVETAGALTEDAIRKAAGTATTDKTGRLPASTVTPVSLGDFAAPDGKGGGKKGGGGRGSRADEYERLSQRIRESADALNAETAAMAQLNPLVNDYGFAVEKARAEQELLSAAKKAGIEVTPKLRKEISDLAEQYALASAEADKLAEAQDKARENAEKWLGVGQDVTKGFIDDLINGKSAAESFANAISKIGDALLDDVLSAIFDIKNASGGGFLGFLGSLFGGGTNWGALSASGKYLFDTGGYTGNGGKYQPKGVVHGGEYVFSKEAVQKAGVGNLEAMHRSLKGYASGGPVGMSIPRLARAQGSGGGIKVNVGVSVDNDGNLQAYVRNVSQQTATAVTQAGLQQYDRNVAPLTVKRVVNDPRQVG